MSWPSRTTCTAGATRNIWNAFDIAKVLFGLHGPADPERWAWTDEVFGVYSEARIEAAKLLAPGADASVVAELRKRGVGFIVARLFWKFNSPISPRDWATRMSAHISPLYDVGVRYYEVGNEPNIHSEASPEGYKVVWMDGVEYGRWFADAVRTLRERFPLAKFGLPGLSPLAYDVDREDFRGRQYEDFLYELSKTDAPRVADWIGAHVYWSHDADGGPAASVMARAVADRFPGLPWMVTEYSMPNSVADDVRARSYLDFYRAACALPRPPLAIFAFLVSASRGFENEVWLGRTRLISAVARRGQ